MPNDQAHNLNVGSQTASIWLDESGSRATARDCFVVAGLKTRHADKLLRAIHSVREEHQEHAHELKWGRISDRTARIYDDVIQVVADSDARIVASVIDGTVFNPFRVLDDPWRAHAHVISRLVQGNVNRNEVVNVMMDGITTPPGVALGQVVKRQVNGRLRTTSVIDAVSLNSKSNDLLQVADMIAGAIFYSRVKAEPGNGDGAERKRKVAQRLAWAFDQPTLREDVRTSRVSIMTLEEPRDSRWVRKENGNGRPGRSRGARQ